LAPHLSCLRRRIIPQLDRDAANSLAPDRDVEEASHAAVVRCSQWALVRRVLRGVGSRYGPRVPERRQPLPHSRGRCGAAGRRVRAAAASQQPPRPRPLPLPTGWLPGLHVGGCCCWRRCRRSQPHSTRDFRPKGGSALHNMGAGAYTSVGDYWIPGQQSHLASHPIPAHGGVMDCTGVDCWVELMWRAAFDATDHRLFVLALNESTVSEHAGISEENERLSATEDAALSLMMQRHVLRRPNPEVVVTLKSASVAGRHQLPIPLGGGTFLWRVDAVEMDGQTVRQGQTWRFTAHR
jgi:hypothetical protein